MRLPTVCYVRLELRCRIELIDDFAVLPLHRVAEFRQQREDLPGVHIKKEALSRRQTQTHSAKSADLGQARSPPAPAHHGLGKGTVGIGDKKNARHPKLEKRLTVARSSIDPKVIFFGDRQFGHFEKTHGKQLDPKLKELLVKRLGDQCQGEFRAPRVLPPLQAVDQNPGGVQVLLEHGADFVAEIGRDLGAKGIDVDVDPLLEPNIPEKIEVGRGTRYDCDGDDVAGDQGFKSGWTPRVKGEQQDEADGQQPGSRDRKSVHFRELCYHFRTMLREIDPHLIPGGLLDGALAIVRRLREAGYEALFAGGAVRDLLLGRVVSDIDIATSAPPDRIESLFERTIPVGKQFGVIVVVLQAHQYEVATFRTDSGYADGRRPTAVAFSDAKEDALRRDFTVNALFLEPLSDQLLDYVGGEQDLKRRLIRTVGDPAGRFQEDKLRILRAVRFACQLDFEIDPPTYAQVHAVAPALLQVSWERIREELLKMLTGSAPARALDLMADTGILGVILPEVAAMRGVPQPPEFHPEGDVFAHTRLMFEKAESLDGVLALAILLHDVGKPPTLRVRERIRFDGHADRGAEIAEAVCRRLRLPNDQADEVIELVRDHLRFIPIREMRESTLKRFLRRPNIGRHLELHRLDCLASHGDLTNYDFALRKLQEFSREGMKPRLLLNGRDLEEAGLKPGPLFKEILNALEDEQLEGRISTRREALDWLRSRYLGGAATPD